MIALQLPSLEYMLASLRAVGWCYACAADPNIPNLMWRIRLASMESQQRYLQEVVANSSLARLPPAVRNTFSLAARSLEFAILRTEPKASTAGTNDLLDVAVPADSPHT